MPSAVDIATALAVGTVSAVIKPVRPEPGPATERWGVGVGEAAARLPKLPGPLRGLALGLEPDGQALRLRGRLELGAAG